MTIEKAESEGQGQEPRSDQRRRAILRAAAEIFMRDGYVGTSMDEIAAAASASKQTVYKHFTDKESLFTELVVSTVKEVSDQVHDEAIDLRDTDDLESDLRRVAHRQLEQVMTPEVISLRRLVIGEGRRFPGLAMTFFELGPLRTIDTLASSFDHLARRGLLSLGDAQVAAEHFNWLTMSTPLARAMFLGMDKPDGAELEHYADEAVRVFLAAYGV
jgi:AcrR family transcriptional regulator